MRRLPLLALMSIVAIAGLLLAATDGVAPLPTYKPAERRHWAFQPRTQVSPPVFESAADRAWTKTPVDAFLLHGLKKAGLTPAPAADRATLIRRATYDLHGLAPTPEEVQAFVTDTSPDAWAKVVDRLLASPRYGEQWAKHWLDVVRFAETEGFEYDMHRSDAWRYRDYVVNSFNQDKPYDQFVREQLAGDEMNPDDETYLVASGFNRLGPVRKNAGNQLVASSRSEILTEMTNMVGTAFLGMTIGCARCHDHKFDAIRQSDYFRVQGYFAQLHNNDIVKAPEDVQKAYEEETKSLTTRMRQVQREMNKAVGEERLKLEAEFEDLEMKMPDPLDGIFASKNDPGNATPVHILVRGDYLNPAERVGMRPLGVLLPDDTPELPVDTPNPRTKLAEWIVDPANPLTSRVIVNRVWQYHFGRGLVGTANDFGRMGTRPSNPELLDWLANNLIEGGWKLKPLHRMILLSSAYQQSSKSPIEKEAAAKDSENKLVWKFSRRRLSAEEIRDSILQVSGRLNEQMGGPSVMVKLEPVMIKMLKRPQYWRPTKDASQYDRRTLYMIYKRNLVLPFMSTFDAPDLQLSCARREESTHAPQALELLNGELANDLASSFAERLMREAKTPAERVDLAFRLATGRSPTGAEKDLSLTFLSEKPDDALTLKEFALMVLNTNAFLYVN